MTPFTTSWICPCLPFTVQEGQATAWTTKALQSIHTWNGLFQFFSPSHIKTMGSHTSKSIQCLCDQYCVNVKPPCFIEWYWHDEHLCTHSLAAGWHSRFWLKTLGSLSFTKYFATSIIQLLEILWKIFAWLHSLKSESVRFSDWVADLSRMDKQRFLLDLLGGSAEPEFLTISYYTEWLFIFSILYK